MEADCLLPLPPLALDGAELGGQFHQFVYGELTEGFAGDSRVTAEIINLRPICSIYLKFLHQLEGYAPATLQFIPRAVHSLDGDTEVGGLLPTTSLHLWIRRAK